MKLYTFTFQEIVFLTSLLVALMVVALKMLGLLDNVVMQVVLFVNYLF